MHLKQGTLLQNGKYKIEKVLGQGGFGITYLAIQIALNRQVAIKEFFMKEYCNREADTSHVSVPSVGSKELVSQFREKFIKEAQNIAAFNHSNIIRIHDIFEENNTAYYVMEYLDNGSLSDYVAVRGRLSEKEAVYFIRQIADALSYIHEQKINHLDVKPSNILLDKENNAVLIDFGLSKHYNNTGDQTSSTPVGVSKGYAPMEQYKQGGVSKFSPETDIYSLGATFYKLLTGDTPPEADEINENGLEFPSNVILSDNIKNSIIFAMQPRRKDRPQSIAEFLRVLEGEAEDTVQVDVWEDSSSPSPSPSPTPKRNWILLVIMAIVLGVGGYYVYDYKEDKKAEQARIEREKAEQARLEKERKEREEREAFYNRTHGSRNGYEWVDLGLPSGLKWATCNIGANKPEDYGNYYAWGEIKTKSEYTDDNSITYGKKFNDISGDVRYDAARANWGSTWRLPTSSELEELVDKCTWIRTTQNGVKGCKVTGPNGNCIFLPDAGFRNGSSLGNNGFEGFYWSSTPSDYKYSYDFNAFHLYLCNGFYNDSEYVSWLLGRSVGQPVRPVSE